MAHCELHLYGSTRTNKYSSQLTLGAGPINGITDPTGIFGDKTCAQTDGQTTVYSFMHFAKMKNKTGFIADFGHS
jgi:hypothetical protein